LPQHILQYKEQLADVLLLNDQAAVSGSRAACLPGPPAPGLTGL
jgi:hypothetical protein